MPKSNLGSTKEGMFYSLRRMLEDKDNNSIGQYFRDMVSSETETSLFTEEDQWSEAFHALFDEIRLHKHK